MTDWMIIKPILQKVFCAITLFGGGAFFGMGYLAHDILSEYYTDVKSLVMVGVGLGLTVIGLVLLFW